MTGGSRGIGRAIALRFARDGARRVAIGYLRNDRAAEATAAELQAAGTEAVLVRGNVTSARVLEQVAALGGLDVLVHNAATGVVRGALETEEKIELLDRLGHASSKAEEGPREPESRPGWAEIPSAAPADRPLPRA